MVAPGKNFEVTGRFGPATLLGALLCRYFTMTCILMTFG
jgi:hypothetical protein